MICPVCATEIPDDDTFCENCGARLAAPTPPAPGAEGCSCGAPADDVDEDGFCSHCGKRVRRPPTDHIEQAISPGFAAVSDRGLRHDCNEDRVALVQEARGFALVVCDGVSSTRDAEVASALASQVLAEALRETLREAQPEGRPVPGAEAMTSAFAQALSALRATVSSGTGDNVPSTTAVAALVVGEEITLGWAGDSRAYWIEGDTAIALTRDHSWLTAALAAGEIPEAEAKAAPEAHAITRWLGADADPDTAPEIAYHQARPGGALLLCTDGLWNYAPEPERLAALVAALSREDPDALAVTRGLAAFANAAGGRDNVTAALLRFESSTPQTVEEAALSVEETASPGEETMPQMEEAAWPGEDTTPR